MDSLGLLKNLKPGDTFTFSNDKFCYKVVEISNNKVIYRPIKRHLKNNPHVFLIQDKRYGPSNPYRQFYKHDGNVEVFDFLPF
jgi:hypothetical protein